MTSDASPATAAGDGGWPAPSAEGPLAATVALPGSKSLTNRLLILAALSRTPTRITAPLEARDTSLMAAALAGLGVGFEKADGSWLVTPGPLHATSVDCGLAGTVMRFVPPVAALADGPTVFDGDPHARTRPMGTLIDGLRQAGVEVEDAGRGLLPFTVRGIGSVAGGTVTLDASASSQFVSALLLAGARYEHGVDIRHSGGVLPSLPHIEMTATVLARAGVPVETPSPQRWVVRPSDLDLPDSVVEPDLSNAAPFLAAAMVAGGSVTIPHWPAATTQPGDLLRELLASMGAELVLGADGLTVTGGSSIAPLVADLHEASELTPVLAALAALADGESRLSGVAHIRGHETDRLAALRTELNRLGGDVRETEDGLIIRPAPLHAGQWHAYADHRMAQAGAVLGLAVGGIVVDDIASTTKTMSDFPGMWARLLGLTAPTDTTAKR
jgi:3-phosphoshikimate 1-carboxyvinyltransferase